MSWNDMPEGIREAVALTQITYALGLRVESGVEAPEPPLPSGQYLVANYGVVTWLIVQDGVQIGLMLPPTGATTMQGLAGLFTNACQWWATMDAAERGSALRDTNARGGFVGFVGAMQDFGFHFPRIVPHGALSLEDVERELDAGTAPWFMEDAGAGVVGEVGFDLPGYGNTVL